jgi:two-component system, NarL family, response regulator DegU
MSQAIGVLLVDDHALILDGLQQLIDCQHDMDVIDALQDGHHIYRVLQRQTVDVVVLDIEMPYHGFSVLSDIQQVSRKVRVLMLTGHKDNENLRTAITLGADGIAFKSEPFAHIADAIRQVAQGRLVFPRSAQRWLMQDPPVPEELSPRETEVLSLVARGLTNSEIARRLDISKNTVSFHLKNIFCKLDVNNRTEATVWYFSNKSSFS